MVEHKEYVGTVQNKATQHSLHRTAGRFAVRVFSALF